MTVPDKLTPFTVHFAEGVPVKVEVEGKVVTSSLEVFKEATETGWANNEAAIRMALDPGTGLVDIVESRFLGLKRRDHYNAPGLTVLRQAHLDLEGLVVDSGVRAMRNHRSSHNRSIAIYNSMYFTREREFVEDAIKSSQRQVDGKVDLVAYKGCAYVVGRSSETSGLYSEDGSSMDTLDMNWTQNHDRPHRDAGSRSTASARLGMASPSPASS